MEEKVDIDWVLRLKGLLVGNRGKLGKRYLWKVIFFLSDES